MYQHGHKLPFTPAQEEFIASWLALPQPVIQEALKLQAIPAPTFDEDARAAYTKTRFRQIGLTDIHQDSTGNIYGRTPGTNSTLPTLLISAHLDTVFSASTDLTTRHDPASHRIYGPGLGDNSLGLAGLICLADQLIKNRLPLDCTILWVATVGEEGLGDLCGIRAVFDQYGAEIGLAIILEGIGLGRVYHAGLGVRRLKVTTTGPGGHSWLHADRPSAIHHLMRIGAALDDLPLSQEPRASLNIGLIDGGTSINTRAAQASMWIDLRSEESATLAALEQTVRHTVEQLEKNSGLQTDMTVIGDRPAATLPISHPLTTAAIAALQAVNHSPIRAEVGSTDANIPLAAGIPAVCVGISTGGNAHTMQEYIDIEPVARGMQQLSILTLLAAANITTWRNWRA